MRGVSASSSVNLANGYLLPSFHRSHFCRTGALAASHQRSQRRKQPLAHFHFDWAIGTNRLSSELRNVAVYKAKWRSTRLQL